MSWDVIDLADAEAIRRLVEVRVNPAGRGTKIFDPSKVEFTWK